MKERPSMRIPRSFVAAALCASLFLGVSPSLAVERSEIPEKYRWNLVDLYPDETAWTRAKESVQKEIPDLAKRQGHVADSAESLLAALRQLMDLDRRANQVYNYAQQLNDEDTRVAKPAEMRQAADQLRVDLRAASSFLRPEILAAGRGKIEAFAAKPELAEFRQFLEDTLRRGEHTLSAEDEKIVAEASAMADAGQTTHAVFTNAEFPYPTITLESGETVVLDPPGYNKTRASKVRADRVKAFQTFWKEYTKYLGTLGSTLYAQVRGHIFNAQVHKFGGSLEAALYGDNIPPKVYSQLIADVHANLPTLHRYLALRKWMMGLDTLTYEDLYAPIVEKVKLEYTPEEAFDLTLHAVAPLGDPYGATLRKAYSSRWVDLMPSTGKRSGAYSQDTFGVHPFQLQSFNGKYDDVSTLAHESGHSMHSYLSSASQPYVTHDYATFVAEVASTLNENLLFHYMLDHAQDDQTRLFLLGSYLDNLRTTLFRQTLFAEFEMKIHAMAEKGEALSGQSMTEVYRALLKEYYGDAKGVCKVDDLYGAEWSYVPHFYYDFYVYQYATSMIASVSLAQGILEEKGTTGKRDAYLHMLSSGSAEYPVDLLKDAGVDMATSAPFEAAMREMSRIMDEMEKILKK
jgi:oligoendopeptidase F